MHDVMHVTCVTCVTCRHLDQITGGVTPARPLRWRLVILWSGPAEGSLQPVQAGRSSGDKFVVSIVLFINIFITIICVASNHKGAWTRILFHSLHLCNCPTQITKLVICSPNIHCYDMLSVRCYQCRDQSMTESRESVCVGAEGRKQEFWSAQGTVKEASPINRPLLRTAVRGLLANCFYIKHFILDELNSIIVGGFVKKVNLKCLSKELCNDCWASVEDQSSRGEILMDSEGLWVLETYSSN